MQEKLSTSHETRLIAGASSANYHGNSIAKQKISVSIVLLFQSVIKRHSVRLLETLSISADNAMLITYIIIFL